MDLHHRIDFLSNGAVEDGVKSSKILQTHEEIVRLLKDRELSDEHNRELLKSLEKVVSKNTSIQNMENYKLYLRYAHLTCIYVSNHMIWTQDFCLLGLGLGLVNLEIEIPGFC